MTTTLQDHGFLAQHRPDEFTFAEKLAPPPLAHVWRQLSLGDNRAALSSCREILREKSMRNRKTLAALLVATATAELRTGHPQEAIRFAKRSLSVLADQWMAHAIRIAAYEATQAPERAFRYAASLNIPDNAADWDERPSAADIQLHIAALAWRVGAWDEVAARVCRAYPAGVASMPEALQADWFRLAFYRNNPEEAARAARAILSICSVEQLDTLLNAMVQQGWTSEALPLYRDAFARHSASQLLRRRLVGLCIREGELDEARELASAGALNIVV